MAWQSASGVDMTNEAQSVAATQQQASKPSLDIELELLVEKAKKIQQMVKELKTAGDENQTAGDRRRVLLDQLACMVDSVVGELVFGPNSHYISLADLKSYIDEGFISETACEKWKAFVKYTDSKGFGIDRLVKATRLLQKLHVPATYATAAERARVTPADLRTCAEDDPFINVVDLVDLLLRFLEPFTVPGKPLLLRDDVRGFNLQTLANA